MLLRIAFLVSALLQVTPAWAAASGNQTIPAGCHAVGSKFSIATPVMAQKVAFPPTQLQVRTPVAPVPLPSGDRNYLIYELHLSNLAQDPFSLRAIEVIDATSDNGKPLAQFLEADFELILRHPGFDAVDDRRRLSPGQSAVAFLCLSFDRKAPIPHKLRHRVVLGDSYTDGPVIAVRRAPLPVLGRPVTGTDWHPRNGPHAGSHHRMGLFVAGGIATISRRYAIDWRKSRQGESSSGDPRNVRSYFTYGETVLAVADGTVLFALDGMPDNIPRRSQVLNWRFRSPPTPSPAMRSSLI